MRHSLHYGIWLACALGVAIRLGAAPVAPTSAPATSQVIVAATLPADEAKDGFKLLFDGTTKGWRQLGGKTLPAGWDIDEGALHHKPRGGGGDITVDETFDNFELRFDFKIAKDGNSGLK